MRRLNKKQKQFVYHVLNAFKNNRVIYNFLSGGAGVGKIEVITAIVQSVLRYATKSMSFKPDNLPVVVGAPTGKAAFEVLGMTLYCIFKHPPTQHKEKLVDLDDSTVNSLRIKFEETKLFIINEIPIVSVRQLYDIDQRLRQIYCTKDSFENKSVIVVGHLLQLPPVAGNYIFQTPTHLPLGELVGNTLWPKFEMFELDKVMRQKGDLEFYKALNNMSEGCMDLEDIQLLRSCELGVNNTPPKEAIWLFQTNAECQEHNAKVHDELGTEGFLSTAIDKVEVYILLIFIA